MERAKKVKLKQRRTVCGALSRMSLPCSPPRPQWRTVVPREHASDGAGFFLHLQVWLRRVLYVMLLYRTWTKWDTGRWLRRI